MNSETDAAPPLAAPLGSQLYCILEPMCPDRGSLKDRWMVKLCDNRRGFLHPLAIGASPLEAVNMAQDRAAALVRGLQDMENAVKNGPSVTISRSANTKVSHGA